jgi:hypothetical protein
MVYFVLLIIRLNAILLPVVKPKIKRIHRFQKMSQLVLVIIENSYLVFSSMIRPKI